MGKCAFSLVYHENSGISPGSLWVSCICSAGSDTDDRLDVVAKKHAGGSGQAFVVFAEQSAATAAMRALTGELFYGKELVSE